MHAVVRPLRLVVALLLLGLALLPELPVVIDDLYISYAFALSLLERGELTWAGQRVEGYSNFSWVLGLAAARLAGLPVTWAAKAASAVAAALLVVGVHRAAPDGWRGWLAVFAVSAWSALTTWAGRGMETTLFALLLWVGWRAVAQQRWTIASWATFGAALTRPEGGFYVVAMLVAARGRLPAAAWAGVAAVAVYHLGRIGWFGDLLPLTLVAKSGGSPYPFDGSRQLAWEWVGALPVALAALAVWRPDRRIVLLTLVPVAFHAAMLLKMEGDWMGGTRIQLPGMIAGLAALSTAAPRVGGWRWAWLALPLLAWAPSRSEGLTLRLPALMGVFRPGGLALDTPLIGDVVFAIDTLPEGARFETGDIGIPGLIPGLTLVDTNGLVDRRRAFVLAGLANVSTLDADYQGPDGIRCVRRLDTDPESKNPAFKKRIRALSKRTKLDYKGHRHTWSCTPGLEAPDAATREARWLTLLDRLPELPALRWQAARILADRGDLAEAARVYAEDPWLDPDPDVGLLLMDAPLPDTPDGRGFRLAAGDHIRTRTLDAAVDAVIVLDGQAVLDAMWETDGVVIEAWSVSAPGVLTVTPPRAGARLVLRRAAEGRGFVWVHAEHPRAAGGGPPSR